MFERRGKSFPLRLLLLYLICCMTGCSFRVQPSFHFQSDIQIGKVVYPQAVSLLVLRSYQQLYEEHNGFGQDKALWTQSLSADTTCWEYVRDQIVLEEFCCAAALSQMASDYGLTVSDADAEQIQLAAGQYYQSIAALDWAESISAADVEQLLTIYRLAQLCIAELTKDVSPQISDDEVRVIEISRISAASEEQARKVWERLQNGETLEYVIGTEESLHSADLTLRRGEEEEELEEAAFRLKTGEFSPPVLLESGWSILYCQNDYNPELSEQNRKDVYESRKTQAWMPVYKQWAEQAGVYLDQDRWKTWQPVENIGSQENLFLIFREIFPES